jgi:hypothetical protein
VRVSVIGVLLSTLIGNVGLTMQMT